MSEYKTYPAVDADYNFPPEIRRAIVDSPEASSTFLTRLVADAAYADKNTTDEELTNKLDILEASKKYVSKVMSEFQNVFVGKDALAKLENLRVRNNNAFGIGAMRNATRARYNDMFGLNAGWSLDSGPDESDTTFKATRNSGFGSNTQRFNKTGYNNISMGRNSMQCNVSGTDNVFLGSGSGAGLAPISLYGVIANQMPLTVSQSVAVGTNTLVLTTGDGNTAVGINALSELKTGLASVAIGKDALAKLDKNIAPNGNQKLVVNLNVTYVFGVNTITVTQIAHPMAVGYLIYIKFPEYEAQALYVSRVTSNTYTLQCPLPELSDLDVGDELPTSLPVSSGTANITWYANNTKARLNNYNVAVGASAGANLEGRDTDASSSASNTLLGLSAGRNYQDGTPAVYLSNVSALGANSAVSGNNQIQLGANTVDVYTGKAIQIRSDLRDKIEIEDTVLGLAFINALRPVDYRHNFRSEYVENQDVFDSHGNVLETKTVFHANDKSKAGVRKHHGLIAQEVESLIKKTGIDFGGFQDHAINGGNDILSLGMEEFIAPLIKAVQELTAKVEYLESK